MTDELYQKILDGEISDEELLHINEEDDEPLTDNQRIMLVEYLMSLQGLTKNEAYQIAFKYVE
jgi:DNA-binding protein Fis